MSAKKSFAILSILSSIFLITSIYGTAEAESVYAITDHHATTLKKYEIQGNQLQFKAVADVHNYALGACGVAVDSNLKLVFVTYEDVAYIVWVNTKTLEEEGFIDLGVEPYYASELAGVVADEMNRKVYAVERGGNRLFICEWDGDKLVLADPCCVTLTDLSGAMGLTFDKITRRLYVANQTNTVNYYDADDPNWAHLGSRDVGWGAMDVAVDAVRGYLYSGGFWCGHTYLVKHDLECESNCNTETAIGTVVVGLAVDPASGLVYCTTSDYKVRVYDCSGPNCVCTDSEPTGGTESGPAGICVESAGPCPLFLEKIDDVNDGNCVRPGDIIKYTIDYNYPSGPNCPDINDVNIIDYLPDEVDFNDASAGGVYNPGPPRTVTWYIGTLHPGDSGFVTLKVNVKPCVKPCITITNECVIESNGVLISRDYEDTPVCRNYLVVEDFESYASETELEVVWGLTGSDISLEDTIVKSGKSMKYHYTNNTPPYYTEADANTTGPNSLPIDTQDWTTAGIKALVVNFYGTAGNATEQLYVALKDTDSNTAVVEYGDSNDLNEPEWHEWNIELNDFNDINDVNLSSIDKVYIGFGNREIPVPGGSGTVYFDDIRLYPRRCVPSFGPEADLDNDCDVDFVDFSMMAGDWLEMDYNGVGRDADVNGSWKTGADCEDGGCVALDGVDNWVDLDDTGFSDFHNKTIAFWVRIKEFPSVYRYIFYFSDEDEDNPYCIYFMTYKPDTWEVRVRFLDDFTDAWVAGLDVWKHVAFVIKDTPDGRCTGTFYGDAEWIGSAMTGRPRHSGGAYGVNIGSEDDGQTKFVNARFDDFRVYDYALSAEEIDYLCGGDAGCPDGTGDPQAPVDNLLLYHYKFDEGTGTIAANSSTYEFYHPLVSVAELYKGEAEGSRVVNFRDFAILADNWLEENLWP